ncbi:hypothetical protein V6N13_143793 [Hibiscus sabdariffa]
MVVAGHDQVFGGEEESSVAIADHPDPVMLELTRLQNQLKEKDRELGAAQAEIKALRATEVLKDKAIEELHGEVQKLDEKHRITENLLQQKNLEITKLINEKKDAVAAQFAAEATLRRVHANQKDDEHVPIESIIAPLEAKIKMYKNEIAVLHQDKRALEHLTKSKESALLEAEKILRSALERALIVEEEENKVLEKTNRQKALEIEKLSQTIRELEEAILAGGAAANTVRDCRRQISQLQEEKRTLERELARVKVAANRIATVAANEWKDENNKVMPVQQWLEDRRLLQAEMQRLKDKLAVSERTTMAEAQLKEKFKLRLKILEDGLKHVSGISSNPNASQGSPKPEKSSNILGFLTSSSGLRKRSTSQPRASTIISSSPPQRARSASGENMLRKKLWASRCKLADSNEKENAEMKVNRERDIHEYGDAKGSVETKNNGISNGLTENRGNVDSNAEDMVSGFLYDRLQKEMLMKKVEAFSKAMEVEAKRIKREAVAKEKENRAAAAKMDDDAKKMKNTNSSRARSRRLGKPNTLMLKVSMKGGR